MGKVAVVLLTIFQGAQPSTGNPILDVALHYGALSVLCLVLYVLLNRYEARYAALAAGYKEELTASITVRTEIRNELKGLAAEIRETHKQRERENAEILRRVCQMCKLPND